MALSDAVGSLDEVMEQQSPSGVGEHECFGIGGIVESEVGKSVGKKRSIFSDSRRHSLLARDLRSA